MKTFTSSLPNDLMLLLAEKSKSLSIPKNKIIEKALRLYLEHLERSEYMVSYAQAAHDENILAIAEEGMSDYLRQIEST